MLPVSRSRQGDKDKALEILSKADEFVRGRLPIAATVILLGPEKAMPNRPKTSANVMPAFDSLADEDIAAIATYVRKTFGKGASAVTPAQVKAQRPK